MVDVTDSISGLNHLGAFYNSTTQKFSIVGHNSASSPVTISGEIDNLPVAVSSMNIYQTNANVNFQQGPSVPVTGGRFQVTVAADTFFSLSN